MKKRFSNEEIISILREAELVIARFSAITVSNTLQAKFMATRRFQSESSHRHILQIWADSISFSINSLREC